jgi:hypothetical protein
VAAFMRDDPLPPHSPQTLRLKEELARQAHCRADPSWRVTGDRHRAVCSWAPTVPIPAAATASRPPMSPKHLVRRRGWVVAKARVGGEVVSVDGGRPRAGCMTAS